MLFPTIDFAIFFAVAFVVSWLFNPYPTLWKLAIIALSYFFYSWWDWRFVFLLLAATVLAHTGAIGCARRERSPRVATVSLVGSLI
ncbi:MAG: MBOAT family O-acyltransferase, partial [Acidimicrobiales bacterium]